jgi:hypothetical protein
MVAKAVAGSLLVVAEVVRRGLLARAILYGLNLCSYVAQIRAKACHAGFSLKMRGGRLGPRTSRKTISREDAKARRRTKHWARSKSALFSSRLRVFA